MVYVWGRCYKRDEQEEDESREEGQEFKEVVMQRGKGIGKKWFEEEFR